MTHNNDFDVAHVRAAFGKALRDQGMETAHATDPDFTFPGEGREGLKISVTTAYKEVSITVSTGDRRRKDTPVRVTNTSQITEARHYIDRCIAEYREKVSA